MMNSVIMPVHKIHPTAIVHPNAVIGKNVESVLMPLSAMML